MGRLLGVVLVVAATLAACSPNDPPGGEGRLSVATGGTGGVYQVYGGALADLLSDELPDSPTTAETTSASVDNLLLVAGGDSDIAFTLADTAIDAVQGRAGFDEPLPLRALATLYPNITQVVVEADSDIETIEDMRGKTVSVGSPGSGTEVIALRLLAVAGVDPDDDITKRQLGVGESVQAIRDGSIDAFFWSGGVPTGAVTDLATTEEIRLLALDGYLDEMRERYGAAYAEAAVEDDEYAGVAGTTTIGVPNLLMVHERMSDELAHRITQVLYDGKDQLATVVPAAESLDPEKGREVVEPVRLHPGAERYYSEQGLAAAGPHVVARADDGRAVADLRLGRSRTFALDYVHSYYRRPARETFRARGDGTFELVAISSPSEAVLDYYEIEGERARRGGRWTLRPASPARFDTMALAATPTGRRTLVAGARRQPLYRGPVHLRLSVEEG